MTILGLLSPTLQIKEGNSTSNKCIYTPGDVIGFEKRAYLRITTISSIGSIVAHAHIYKAIQISISNVQIDVLGPFLKNPITCCSQRTLVPSDSGNGNWTPGNYFHWKGAMTESENKINPLTTEGIIIYMRLAKSTFRQNVNVQSLMRYRTSF